MTKTSKTRNLNQACAPLAKKTYTQPKLQVFGKLHSLTQGTATMNTDGANSRMSASDRSIKESIVRVGTHSLGIGLYVFDYKREHRARWGYGRQLGVMADEVEVVLPDAVAVHPDGYKMVNYEMLEASQAIQ